MSGSQTVSGSSSRLARILAAIGIRILVYGGLVLLVALLFAYVRLPRLNGPSTLDSGAGDEPVPTSGPGWPHLRGPNLNSWHSDKMSNDVVSSVLVDGYVYGFDLRDIQSKARRPSRGEFRCLDFKTGEVQWSSDQPGHASAIAADGKLLLFNDRGQVLLVRATPTAYEELARVTLFDNEIC